MNDPSVGRGERRQLDRLGKVAQRVTEELERHRLARPSTRRDNREGPWKRPDVQQVPPLRALVTPLVPVTAFANRHTVQTRGRNNHREQGVL